MVRPGCGSLPVFTAPAAIGCCVDGASPVRTCVTPFNTSTTCPSTEEDLGCSFIVHDSRSCKMHIDSVQRNRSDSLEAGGRRSGRICCYRPRQPFRNKSMQMRARVRRQNKATQELGGGRGAHRRRRRRRRWPLCPRQSSGRDTSLVDDSPGRESVSSSSSSSSSSPPTPRSDRYLDPTPSTLH